MEKPQKQNLRYLAATALCAAGMMLVLYILLGIWPFGARTVVTGDLGGLYINYFSHLKRFVLGDAGFAYGFDKGLGGSLLGLFSYYYASPLNILYVLFPVRWYPVVAAAQLFIKAVLACCFFQMYIAKKFPRLRHNSVALALCYGFMAYLFAYAQNIMWMDVVVLLPLVCLGIDNIVEGKPFFFYTAVLALSIFSNFYISYMACIFAVLYFAYSMLTREKLPTKQQWKETALPFLKGSLLGGGACAALLVPALVDVNQTKGGIFSFDFSLDTNFSLLRLPERFAFGSFAATDVEGKLPFVYCGVLVLVLGVSHFVSRNIPLRERLLSGAVLLLFVLSFWLYGPDTFWHGLKEPIWFPARYSFVFCFFAVLLAAKAVAQRAAGRREVVLAGGSLFIVFLFMCAFPISISRGRILLTAAAALFYSLAILLWESTNDKLRRRVLHLLVSCAVAVELVANAFYITRQFELYSLEYHQSYLQTAGGAVAAIQNADDGDYRIAENQLHTLNDPMLLGYWGISHFGSTQDGHAQGMLHNLGYRTLGSTGPYMNGGTAFADALLGLEYLYDSGERPVPAHWQAAGIQAELPVYQNPYALPMAFAFTPPENQLPVSAGSLPAAGGQEDQPQNPLTFQNEMYSQLGYGGQLLQTAELVELIDEAGNALPLTGEVPVGAVYTMTAQKDGYYYAWFEAGTLLLPMYVNGVYTDIYFSPYNGGVVDLGFLEAGQTATVYWDAQTPIQMNAQSFAYIQPAKLEDIVATAQNSVSELQVQDGRLDTVVQAYGEAPMLYTSIPWQEGWHATVNGKTVQAQPFMDNWLSVPLEVGENTVQLRFRPSGAGVGAAISVVCIGLFVFEVVRHKRKKRTALLAVPQPAPVDTQNKEEG